MAEPFFIDSEMLKSKYDKYIMIKSNTDEEVNKVLQIIKYLTQRKIFLKGVVTEKNDLIGEMIYNKKIINLKKVNGIVFNNDLFPIDFDRRFYNIRNVNQNIDNKEIVIYGSGKNGVKICKYLQNLGWGIKCFIDTNAENVGKTVNGVVVYSTEIIRELDKDIVIIEAYEKWWEMDERIRTERTDIKCFYYTCNNDDDLFIRNIENKEILFSLEDRIHIFKLCEKDIFIYGAEENAEEVYRYFEILGLSVKGLLIEKDVSKYEHSVREISVIQFDEVIGKENIFIWIEQNDRCSAIAYLKSQGLQIDRDFGGYFPIKYVLDINLGISYIWKHEYAGITAYGKEKVNDYKIVVLGNSTTDSTKAYPHKSWAELLYEKFNRQDLTIYNAGVGSYFSGQELLKLIRDCRKLEPDLVISYSGINDMGYKYQNHPFLFTFEKDIYRFAYEDIKMQRGTDKWRDYLSIAQGITYGIPSPYNRFENWVRNEDIMHAVAKCYGADFECFLQPAIYSKQNTDKEKKIIKDHYIRYNSDYSETANLFRDNIESIISERKYIHNLSNIFDGEDVYEDICHVNMNGNRIIAEEIGKVIQKYI